MKKIRVALVTLPALLPVFLLPAAANAATVQTGSGSFTSTVVITSVTQDGPNMVIAGTETQQITGTLNGVRVATGVEVVQPDGHFVAHDQGTFTGTVDGQSGSIEIDGESSGVGNSGNGTIHFSHGTGGLAGLDAEGTFAPMFTSFSSASGSYTVKFHFGS